MPERIKVVNGDYGSSENQRWVPHAPTVKQGHGQPICSVVCCERSGSFPHETTTKNEDWKFA
eukprot:2749664-Amphidinium_carterae.1